MAMSGAARRSRKRIASAPPASGSATLPLESTGGQPEGEDPAQTIEEEAGSGIHTLREEDAGEERDEEEELAPILETLATKHARLKLLVQTQQLQEEIDAMKRRLAGEKPAVINVVSLRRRL